MANRAAALVTATGLAVAGGGGGEAQRGPAPPPNVQYVQRVDNTPEMLHDDPAKKYEGPQQGWGRGAEKYHIEPVRPKDPSKPVEKLSYEQMEQAQAVVAQAGQEMRAPTVEGLRARGREDLRAEALRMEAANQVARESARPAGQRQAEAKAPGPDQGIHSEAVREATSQRARQQHIEAERRTMAARAHMGRQH